MKNYIIDTNVLLRYFIKDIPKQYEIAKTHIEAVEQGQETLWLSILVVNEALWIMKNYYHIPRDLFIAQLLKVVSLHNVLTLEGEKDDLYNILATMQNNAIDFTDMYLYEVAKGRKILTLYKDFEKLRKL